MYTADPLSARGFDSRYSQLARGVGLDPATPVLVALSGGADSVLLLQLVARERPRPDVVAVHVDHGLRGAESDADVVFCERMCADLRVPLSVRRVHLAADGPSLEARAREARYSVLLEEAQRRGGRVILTGHHADDALETVLMRWSRGTDLGGLAGLRARSLLGAPDGGEPIWVVRPLIRLRREEVRRLLLDAGIEWREDSSNRDARFTRNRVRNDLLPRIAELCGPESIEHLFAFGRAVEELENDLAGATAHLCWQPFATAAATRSLENAHLGGSVPRSGLMRLPRALRRRAVWRLLCEGTSRAPRRRLLERVLAHLETGRSARHTLGGGWYLKLGADRLDLCPPLALLEPHAGAPHPLPVLFALAEPQDAAAQPHTAFRALLAIPGLVDLPDGRRIGAESLERDSRARIPRGACEVELDARALDAPLAVRFPQAGDRFRPLGAPGSRPLVRFLADAGVPRSERARVPLVLARGEIVWVAGLRPAEHARIQDDCHRRVRLRLYGAAEPGSSAQAARSREPRWVEKQLFEPGDS